MTLPVTRSLLEGIVDYAGLFPPAGLDMAATVANYERYLRDDYAWMLGRLVVTVARLDEFTDIAGGMEGVETWRLSAVVGEDHPGEIVRVLSDTLDDPRHSSG
ncbi:MAG: hypothetical protein IH969_08620, partial [Candidatus Krumholzibacteriota bacterium]|nr:hypothetical protein [Candidatus Krumholzibacteriota bacterium]